MEAATAQIDHVTLHLPLRAKLEKEKADELKLNQRQRRFAQLIVEGRTQREAYLEAGYDSSTPEIADANASLLIRNSKVQSYIDYLRLQDSALSALSRAEKRLTLAQTVRNPEEMTANKLAAIKIDNQMTGDDAPIKVEHEVSLASVWSKLQSTNGLPSEEVIDLEDEKLFD